MTREDGYINSHQCRRLDRGRWYQLNHKIVIQSCFACITWIVRPINYPHHKGMILSGFIGYALMAGVAHAGVK